MLAWEKAAIESNGAAVDILVAEICPQNVFLPLDLTMSRKLSEACFENGLQNLEGQLEMQYTATSRDQPPKSQ